MNDGIEIVRVLRSDSLWLVFDHRDFKIYLKTITIDRNLRPLSIETLQQFCQIQCRSDGLWPVVDHRVLSSFHHGPELL